MNSTIQACDAETTRAVPHQPAMNALRHGVRSQTVLLPGEDPQAFEARCQDMMHAYQVCTREEARCVRRMAACEWRMERYSRWEIAFEDKLDALVTDESGTVAQHVDPDPHRWQHRAIDCTLQEGRMERMLLRTERRLLAMQSLRRQGLMAPGDALLAAADSQPEPRVPSVATTPATVPADAAAGPVQSVSPGEPHGTPGCPPPSPGKGIAKNGERETVLAPEVVLRPRLVPFPLYFPSFAGTIGAGKTLGASCAVPPAASPGPCAANPPHAQVAAA